MNNHRLSWAAVFIGARLAAASSICITGGSIMLAFAPRAAAQQPSEIPEPWRLGRSQDMLKVLDDYVDWIDRNDPVGASTRGKDAFNNQLPDASPAAAARRVEESRSFLERLRALDASRLSEADRTDAGLLRWELERSIAGAKFHREQLSVDARSGPQVDLPQIASSLPLRTPGQFAAYATRLEKVPAYIDQMTEELRLGLKARRTQPKVAMVGVAEQARLLASRDIEETPALSPFYEPFRSKPLSDPDAARARKAIAEGIIPAYRRFAEFIEKEYLPACSDSIAYSSGVDGPEAYAFALQGHTTLDLTPDQVHQIGLKEVARIRAEMLTVIPKTDFPRRNELSGDALLAAFFEYLRTEPRFYYQTADELLTGYREIAKRIDPELTRMFGTLPRLTYGVRELPAFAAPTSPTAYYYPGSAKGGVPGYFMANTYALDQRPKYEMVSLTLHEAVPGHHLQISLAEELEGVHEFRTLRGFTAFVEGWGLYSEHLGLEMGEHAGDGKSGGTGLYSDPYNDFGRLTYEMWRSCRLVVDTGMHSKGWSRSRAIEYMQSNTALSKLNIEREIDRYIAWPGQACAYKLGEMKIRELRARAERELGSAFQVRAFHDAVLGAGALPLSTLEERIDRWIATQKSDHHRS